MGKRLFWWELGAAIFTAVAGTLLHFTYAWSGESPLAGSFSAVNESVWEHMKLLFVPMFAESLVHGAALGGLWPNFPAARAAAVLLGLTLIPTAFYTYTGIFGAHALWADIGLFLLADGAAFALEHFLLRKGKFSGLFPQIFGLTFLWGIAFAFVWCTFHPPKLPLWRDMLTGTYGMLR